MTKINFLKDLVSQLGEALPSHLGTLKEDFEKNCHTILNKTLNKFDLITREEFDTQKKVLSRTRKRLEDLEAHLKVLEEGLKAKPRSHQKNKE